MGPVAAARRKLEIERELGQFDKHSGHQVLAMQDERAALIAQHPDIEDVTSQDMLRDYSTSLRGRRGAQPDWEKKKDRAAKAAEQLASKPAQPRGRARPPKTSRRRPSTASPRRVASRSSNRLARAIRTGVRDTGVPAAARSTTRTALNFVGAGFGLSILYLLLTNAEHARPGKSAVELFSKGVGRTAQALVSPAVDPLSPGKVATKPVDLSGVNASVDAYAQAASRTTGQPIIPGITPLVTPTPIADLAQGVLAGVHAPHLAVPYHRPPVRTHRPVAAPQELLHR